MARNGNNYLSCATSLFIEGGVVAYPVMQAYGSLALEENSEVNEAVLVKWGSQLLFPDRPIVKGSGRVLGCLLKANGVP